MIANCKITEKQQVNMQTLASINIAYSRLASGQAKDSNNGLLCQGLDSKRASMCCFLAAPLDDSSV